MDVLSGAVLESESDLRCSGAVSGSVGIVSYALVSLAGEAVR